MTTISRTAAGVPQGGEFAAHSRSGADITLVEVAPELAGVPAPVILLDNLTHVGKLDPGAKGAWSLEGRGLSVSQHPDDWSSIAGLSGKTWEFNVESRPFLNYHELTSE